jgi:hypothetical protein
MQVPAQVYAIMEGLSPSLTVNNAVSTSVVNYNSGTTSGEGIITADTATGFFTVALGGYYHVSGLISWDVNTTGSRFVGLGGTNFLNNLDFEGYTMLATNFYSSYAMHVSKIIALNANATVQLKVLQNSGAARTIGNANFRLVRL